MGPNCLQSLSADDNSRKRVKHTCLAIKYGKMPKFWLEPSYFMCESSGGSGVMAWIHMEKVPSGLSTRFICYFSDLFFTIKLPGRVAQSVTCLGTDASLTADQGGREFDPSPVPYFHGD